MSHLHRNTLANLIGRGWTKALGLIVIPLYIKFLGIEAFGLVGFYVTLQSILGLLDFGIGAALNREIARLSALEGNEQEQGDLVRTLEIIYWSVAIILGGVIYWLSPVIAHYWVKPQSLSVVTIERAVSLMGFAFLFQFPLCLYQYGLMGKERQVLVNGILGSVAAVQGVGAVLLLWLVSPTIECFFLWQISISFLGTGVTAYSLWRILPASPRNARFRTDLLQTVWRFAAGWSGFAVTQTIVFHADRVVLSKILPLDIFGYYILAQAVAMALWAIVESVTNAALPRFSQLVVLGDEIELTTTYHRACQFLSVILVPVALVMALFSWEIVNLWTRNSTIASTIYQITSLLIIGIMFRGLSCIPLCLQLAYGWFRLALSVSLVSAICAIPLIAIMAKRYGVMGAATVSAMQHVIFFLAMPLMYFRYLKDELRQWLMTDLLRPLGAALLIVGAGRLLYPSMMGSLASLTFLAAVWLLSTAMAVLMTPGVRTAVLNRLWIRTEANVG